MRLRQPRFMPPNASALLIALLVALTGCGPSSADDDDSIPTDDDDSTQGDDDDSAQSHSQSWSLSFPREALERVSLTNSVGQLSLSGSPGATEVSVQLIVYSNAPLDLAPFLPLTTSLLPSSLSISVAMPEGNEFTRADLSLHAPSSLIAEMTATDFPLSISDMHSGGTIRTVSGSVTGIGLRGSFEVEGESSEFLLDVDLPTGGSLDASLSSGPIETTLPIATSATLAASTALGAIEIIGMDFNGVIAGGEAAGQFGEGEGSISLSTGEGDISIRGVEAPGSPVN